MVSARPRAPFDSWAVQIHDASFGFAWWTEPATWVFQATTERATAEAAEWVQRWIDRSLEEREAEIRAAGGLFVFHDWRAMRSYDTEGRTAYLARMRQRPREYLRHSVVVVPSDNVLLRMAVETGNLVASLVTGRRVELAIDAEAALAAHRIAPPTRNTRPPSMAPGMRRGSIPPGAR